MTEKTANQLYKESGTTLSFKDWIEREKLKGVNIPNPEANTEMLNMLGNKDTGENKNDKLIRNILITVGLIGAAYIGYRMIKKQA